MRPRRGFVLLVVLIVVAAAVLAVTGTIFLVRGEVAGTANAGESVRVRAVATSGVAAVAARLGQSRGEILAGGEPLIEPSFILWDAGGERGVVQLLPLGPEARTLVPENAKIDLGRVDAEGLVRGGTFDTEAAARVIAARDAVGGRPLELDGLLAHGALPEDLHGDLDDSFLAAFGDVESTDEDLAAASRDAALEVARGVAPAPRGLSDLATVFSFDPPIASDGTPRILVADTLDEEDREILDRRLGDGAAAALARIAGEAPDEAALVEAWSSVRPDPSDWSALLDAVTLIEAGLDEGRLDILRAGEAALAALPGLGPEVAARIVRERDAVPAEGRLDPAWLVERGIVDAGTFRALLPRLATRSLFWRVRVEGRIERTGDDRPPEPTARVILEAVIDLTGERPRLASLRDVTALPDAIRMLASLPTPDERPEAEADLDPLATPENEEPSELPEPEPVLEEVDPGLPAPVEAESAARSGAKGIGRWKRAG